MPTPYKIRTQWYLFLAKLFFHKHFTDDSSNQVNREADRVCQLLGLANGVFSFKGVTFQPEIIFRYSPYI